MVDAVGKMDQVIRLQAPRQTSDGIGGETLQWVDLPQNTTVWAKVIAKAGRETITDGRMAASMITLFIIYNRSDLDETMRIVWGGANFNIRGIRREGHSPKFLTIEAERGVA